MWDYLIPWTYWYTNKTFISSILTPGHKMTYTTKHSIFPVLYHSSESFFFFHLIDNHSNMYLSHYFKRGRKFVQLCETFKGKD